MDGGVSRTIQHGLVDLASEDTCLADASEW
jgi:hypothetical protein